MKKRVGLPSARNVGIKYSNYDLIGFLDDDCIPINIDLFERAMRWLFLRNLNIIGVGGPVYLRSNGPPAKAQKLKFVNTIPGGNCFYKKDFVERSGGFDPTFDGNAIREESDCCLKLKQYGLLVIDPLMPINHLHINYGGCRVNTYQYYLDVFSNTILLALRHRKIPIEVLINTLNHMYNFLKIVITGIDNNHKAIKRWTLLGSFFYGVFYGFKKYLLPRKRTNLKLIDEIIHFEKSNAYI